MTLPPLHDNGSEPNSGGITLGFVTSHACPANKKEAGGADARTTPKVTRYCAHNNKGTLPPQGGLGPTQSRPENVQRGALRWSLQRTTRPQPDTPSHLPHETPPPPRLPPTRTSTQPLLSPQPSPAHTGSASPLFLLSRCLSSFHPSHPCVATPAHPCTYDPPLLTTYSCRTPYLLVCLLS